MLKEETKIIHGTFGEGFGAAGTVPFASFRGDGGCDDCDAPTPEDGKSGKDGDTNGERSAGSSGSGANCLSASDFYWIRTRITCEVGIDRQRSFFNSNRYVTRVIDTRIITMLKNPGMCECVSGKGKVTNPS